MSTLLTHQQSSIAHLQQWKVGALFMEAGTGKTRVAAELISMVDADLILYICPLRLKDNTRTELEKWGVDLSNFHFVGVESIGQSDRIYLQVREMLVNARTPFIVVDESIKIKNSGAKRTQRLLDYSTLAEYKLILNGTPLTRNILDIYPQMQFLDPRILNMTEGRYKNTFCNYTKITKRDGLRKYTKEFITGYANIDYLYSLIHHYIFECDLDLNIQQNYHTQYYKISEEEKEQYTYLKDKYLDNEMLEFRNNNIFIEMTTKMQHGYCCSESKFDVVDNLFTEIPQDKTIIFCKYVDSNVECTKRYPDALVLSYQKESFGLNLQDYYYTIYFDKTWDYATRIQASRRTYRTGQLQDCIYYDLTGNVGLERMIDNNISSKTNMVEYFKSKSLQEIKEEL